jgi:hypothetical protein
MTRKRYGLYGPNSRDFLTYGGRILVHHDKAQMEFLVVGVPVRELPPDIPEDQTLPIRFHPQMCGVEFTDSGDVAGKEQFRCAT